MKNFTTRLTFIAAALIALPGIYACGSNSDDVGTDVSGTGGQTGGSPGSKGGSGGKTASGGGSTGSGGAATSSGGAGGGAQVDAPVDSPEPGDADAADNADSDNNTGADGSVAADTGTSKVARCAKDVSGLTTCRQLEISCENCPPGGAENKNPTAKKCFDLVGQAFLGMATDADCAKFAVDNKCTVDKGGNICVTVDCDGTPGCEDKNQTDKTACDYIARYGDPAPCQKFLPKCACKE